MVVTGRAWKVGVLKMPSESPRIRRESRLRKVGEHVRQRMEKERQLVELRAQIDKDKQHVQSKHMHPLTTLELGRLTPKDFENEIKFVRGTLETNPAKESTSLRREGVQQRNLPNS